MTAEHRSKIIVYVQSLVISDLYNDNDPRQDNESQPDYPTIFQYGSIDTIQKKKN